MDYLPSETYKRILVVTLYIFLIGLFLFVFFKYLFRLILPFIIAWLVSIIIRPLSETLHRRTKIPKKLLAVILVLFVLAVLGIVIFLLLDKLIYEFRGIVVYITNNADEWVNGLLDFYDNLLEKVPFLQSIASEEELKNVLSNFAQGMLANFTQNVPNMLKNALTVLPHLIFVSLILIMASYYFCADHDDITVYIKQFLPLKVQNRIIYVKNKLKIAGRNVLKGYLLTIALTFIQLYIGLLILKIDYAFSVSFIIALVDILPVIGVGTVLIPWAAVKLIMGSYYQGFGLLIVFAVVSVIREILEPKIIGKSIGLHPLATLFSMYIGLEVCGFIGLISFPVIVIVAKTLLFKTNKV